MRNKRDYDDYHNRRQDRWIKAYLAIMIILTIIAVALFIIGTTKDRIDNPVMIMLSETIPTTTPLPDEIFAGPDYDSIIAEIIANTKTYDPTLGYIGTAIGGGSGFGGMIYFIKKALNKQDKQDDKLDKIDNKLGIVEVKVDRNIDDIKEVKAELNNPNRIKRIFGKEVNNE